MGGSRRRARTCTCTRAPRTCHKPITIPTVIAFVGTMLRCTSASVRGLATDATRKQNTHSPSDSSNSNSASRRRTSSGRTAGSSQPASAIVVVVVVAPRRPENGRRTTNASSHNTRQRLNDGHVWPHQSRRRPARDGVAGGRSSRRPRDLWLPTERPDQVRSTNR